MKASPGVSPLTFTTSELFENIRKYSINVIVVSNFLKNEGNKHTKYNFLLATFRCLTFPNSGTIPQ